MRFANHVGGGLATQVFHAIEEQSTLACTLNVHTRPSEMSNQRRAEQQLQLAGEAFQRGDQRASLEAYKKAFLAAPANWQYRYYSFAGACSLLKGEDVGDTRENVKPNASDMAFLKVE